MLAVAELPQGLWGEAIHSAAHIRNLIPLERQNGKTPMELWTNKRPNISYLRVIGSKAYVLVNDHERQSKFEKKSQEMVLVGYASKQKAYRVWQRGTRKVIISRDVIIVEPKPKQQAVIVETLNEDKVQLADDLESNSKENKSDSSASTSNTEIKPIDSASTRRSKDIKTEEHKDCIAHRTRSKGTLDIATAANAFLADVAVPTTVTEAKTGPHKNQWESAMKAEYDSLIKNNTWTLVNLHEDQKPIKNKWVFRLKVKPDGSIDRFKARLVAKGCSQKAGVDYSETFSPVVRFDSVRTLLSIAAAKNYEVYQLDVKTAFLHGDLNETIFMEQPEDFDDKSGRVCKLNKSLYGLKQAPRQWYAKFDEFMQQFGLKPSNADPCMYTSVELYVALYVDDGLVVGHSKSKIDKLLKAMQSKFEITSSIATCYLGIEIIRNQELKTIKLSQATYTRFVLKRFEMLDCNGVKMPIDPGIQLTRNLDENGNVGPIADVPYQQLIGSLMYLSTGTRPDISYAVNTLSKFLKTPSNDHWQAARRILKYLKSTIDLGIVFDGTNNNANRLIAYSDADYASCPETRKSINGVVLMLNGGPVIWSSRKQGVVATSTTDAEYIAVHEASKEVVWCRRLLNDINIEQDGPTVLFCDNTAAQTLLQNPIFHRRTKHIDIKYHYTRDLIKQRLTNVEHVSSQLQLADILTKPLARERFETNRNLLNMI